MLATMLIFCGCNQPANQAPPKPPSQPNTSITLKIQVLNDPELVQAIGLLKGEWAEQSGGNFEVEEIGPAELYEKAAGDLLIFSPLQLGELCEKQKLRPMRSNVLKDEALNYTDIYPAVRDRLLTYGRQVMALPIGAPAPVLAYNNGDKKLDPPETWGQQPDASPAAVKRQDYTCQFAYLLLSRALSYRQQEGAALFEAATMQPQISSPEFVRALKELRVGAATSKPLKPKVAGSMLPRPGERWRVVWPQRPWNKLDGKQDKVSVTILPGSREQYDPISQTWQEQRSVKHVTIAGSSGRIVAVSAKSRNATTAFKLAAWLTGPANVRQLATKSIETANVRRSLATISDDWSGLGNRELGRQFSAAHDLAYKQPNQFVFPRIIRANEYLDALGGCICSLCISGKGDDLEALERVAAHWQELTDEIGRDRQTKAYLRHLGLLDYTPETR